jgi:hypothetical protein
VKSVFLILVLFLLVAPVLSENIPSENRIHLGDVIAYGQGSVYLNPNIIPEEVPNLFVITNGMIFEVPLSVHACNDPFCYRDQTPRKLSDGGYLDIDLSLMPGQYYGCPDYTIPQDIYTVREMKKYCEYLFTILPEVRP